MKRLNYIIPRTLTSQEFLFLMIQTLLHFRALGHDEPYAIYIMAFRCPMRFHNDESFFKDQADRP